MKIILYYVALLLPATLSAGLPERELAESSNLLSTTATTTILQNYQPSTIFNDDAQDTSKRDLKNRLKMLQVLSTIPVSTKTFSIDCPTTSHSLLTSTMAASVVVKASTFPGCTKSTCSYTETISVLSVLTVSLFHR